MSKTNFKKIFDSFSDLTILVVGDAMIDSYMWGNIHRQSPEAPIPIVDIELHERKLGGAANVALNIKSLGAKPILCSVIGNDDKGMIELMNEVGLSTQGILKEDRKTTVKTRVISKNKHQLRIDEEDTFNIKSEDMFIQKCKALIREVDAIIFQDYNKGVLTAKVISSLIEEAKKNNIHTLVDPKKENYFEYKNVSLFKPNLKELTQNTNLNVEKLDFDDIANLVDTQRKELNAKHFLLTLSEKGIFLKNSFSSIKNEVFIKDIVDVSGAGDSVIAIAALGLCSNLSDKDFVQLCNLTGGIACLNVGVNPIDKEILLSETNRLF